MRNVNRLFVFLFEVVLLWGCCWAANAVTPKIAAGPDHNLAVRADGTVWSWGLDGHGQLGQVRLTQSNNPINTKGLPQVSKLVSGGQHSVALAQNGRVWTWGDNQFGQLGNGSTIDRSSPLEVNALSGVVEISAGQLQSLALKADGTVWSWGSGITVPTQVSSLSGVIGIAAGYYHNLALEADGTVWAWGDNQRGQLGIGISVGQYTTPVQVTGLSGVIAIAAGESHSLAVTGDGSVWAWGYNDQGQLGDGTTVQHLAPILVTNLTGVVGVAAGMSHSLALKGDGTVWGWGHNWNGEVGNGSNPSSEYSPVQVFGLSGIVSIAAGVIPSIAAKKDGSVWAWGYNSLGQLGDGSYSQRLTPVLVTNLTGVVAVSAGGYGSLLGGNSSALKSDGSVWTWGDNGSGQLGDGSDANRVAPTQVTGLSNAVSVAAGNSHSLAVKGDGSVWSWGDNSFGMLGDGSFINRSTPTQVNGLSGVVSIAAGYHHSLALKSDGTVWGWGDNQFGELGTGTNIVQYTTPVQVSGLTGVIIAGKPPAMPGDW